MFGALLAAPAHATHMGLDVNLIQNPGFEDGSAANGDESWASNLSIPSWQKQNGTATVIEYGSPGGWPTDGDPGPPNRGDAFYSGGDSEFSSIHQTIDVDASLFPEIDQDKILFEVSGWFGGWETHDDNSKLTIHFLDSGGFVLDAVTIGGFDAGDRNNDTELLFDFAEGVVPEFTESIEVWIESLRTDGTSNDGYVDEVALTLHLIPEPSTVLLLGSGLLGLAYASRRTRRL